ncbi:MAG: hypothetical protein LIO65_03505, partial [Odoribacter sp.]|nr:hypothetical protein [Odoribacter sp.]
TGAFIKITGNEEKIITHTGIPDDYKFFYNDSILVWTEYKAHPRWEHGGKQILSSYNLASRKYIYHKSPSNRFSPFALGENWGVVEVDEQNNSFIVILDKSLNHEIQRIPANTGELFIHPSFDGNEIIVVVQSNKGNRIESINPVSLERKELTQWFRYEIDNPQRLDNRLLFRASFNDNNAFYSMNLDNGEITNILNSPFGIRFPAINAKKDSLYFSFYTANGYKPAEISINNLENKPAEMKSFPLADTLVKYESGQRSFYTDSIFASKKYSKFTHLFNIHSWGPMYVEPDNMSATVGLVAYSQNKLSTLILSGGYVYDSDYDKGSWKVNAQYKALWPTFNLKFESGKMNSYTVGSYTQNDNSTNLFVEYDYRFSETELTMQLPFTISRRNYNRAIIPYSRYTIGTFHNYDIRHVYEENEDGYMEVPRNKYPLSFSSRYYQVMEYGLLFYNQTRRTTQEINPRWGQRIQGGYSHTPFKNIDLGAQWWIYGNFYFPGLFINHSLNIYAGYQDRPHNFSYGKKVASGRGISVWGYDFGTLRTSYALPLAYPDWRIGGLAYLQTINASFFWDGSRQYIPYRNTSNNIEYLWKNYCSYGMELTTDCYVVRLPFPVYTGFRLGYETQHKDIFAEFLLSVTFSL